MPPSSQSSSIDSTVQTLDWHSHWSLVHSRNGSPLALEAPGVMSGGQQDSRNLITRSKSQASWSMSSLLLVILVCLINSCLVSPVDGLSSRTESLEDGIVPQSSLHRISTRSVEDYTPFSQLSMDPTDMHRQDRDHYFRSLRSSNDHYFRSLRTPDDHYFRSIRTPSNHYFRSLREASDQFYRSLKSPSNHYFRSMRSPAIQEDSKPNDHYFRSLRVKQDNNNHYFRSLRSAASPSDHYFRSLRTPSDSSPSNHYFRSMRSLSDHYFRSLRSNSPQDHYFRSLRSEDNAEDEAPEGEEEEEEKEVSDDFPAIPEPMESRDENLAEVPKNHYFRSLRAKALQDYHYQRAIKAGAQNHYFRSLKKRAGQPNPVLKRLYGEITSPQAFDHYFRSLRAEPEKAPAEDLSMEPAQNDQSYLNQLLIQSVLNSKPYQPLSMVDRSSDPGYSDEEDPEDHQKQPVL